MKADMAKAKLAYVCSQCGGEHSKWQGQCAECGAWNTLSEFVVEQASRASGSASAGRTGYAGSGDPAQVTRLSSIGIESGQRIATGIGELDRVLGGGLMAGSVVLIGGDPGIGKSTLLLQMLGAIAGRTPSLYVTGEESLAQVAERGHRLGLDLDRLDALADTSVERILAQAATSKPEVLIIDSIQTIWTETLGCGSRLGQPGARVGGPARALCQGTRHQRLPGRACDQGRWHRRPQGAGAHGRCRAVFRG
jgi:DNA repair protein RadA/Sms